MITASAGKTLYHAQLVFTNGTRVMGVKLGEAFTANLVVDGKKYEEGRLMFQAGTANGGKFEKGSLEELMAADFPYIINSVNNTETCYYNALFEYVVEVPADITSTASDVYLQINMKKTDAYFNVPLA